MFDSVAECEMACADGKACKRFFPGPSRCIRFSHTPTADDNVLRVFALVCVFAASPTSCPVISQSRSLSPCLYTKTRLQLILLYSRNIETNNLLVLADSASQAWSQDGRFSLSLRTLHFLSLVRFACQRLLSSLRYPSLLLFLSLCSASPS